MKNWVKIWLLLSWNKFYFILLIDKFLCGEEIGPFNFIGETKYMQKKKMDLLKKTECVVIVCFKSKYENQIY